MTHGQTPPARAGDKVLLGCRVTRALLLDTRIGGEHSESRARFRCFFDEHVDHVRTYAMTLVLDEEADDVMQRTFVTVVGASRSHPGGPGREWLFGVVRNQCRNGAVRTSRRRLFRRSNARQWLCPESSGYKRCSISCARFVSFSQ